jgi:hypothetical protein
MPKVKKEKEVFLLLNYHFKLIDHALLAKIYRLSTNNYQLTTIL